jgi:hypothetical protein
MKLMYAVSVWNCGMNRVQDRKGKSVGMMWWLLVGGVKDALIDKAAAISALFSATVDKKLQSTYSDFDY